MKNATQRAEKLAKVLRSLPAPEPNQWPDAEDPIAVLIQSALLWEATTAQAMDAYRRIRQEVVDTNDLRVCMPHEIVTFIGDTYPFAVDRAILIRSVLHAVFYREHAVSLDHLREAGKREVRSYIETLDGINSYVASRVMLLCFDTHAIPVDYQLRGLLIAEEAADEEADINDLSAWLSRHIKAQAGPTAHLKFQHWVDSRFAPKRSRSGRPSKKKSSGGTRKKAGRAGK